MGIESTPEERLEVFGALDPDTDADDAHERWGDTEAYRESTRRTARYTKADWERIKAEGGLIAERLASAMRAGEPATSDAAMDAAEAHRQQIDSAFYPCSYEMHRGLAGLYIADPRFAATYDGVAPGLAQYVHDAIVANADRHGDAATG